MVVGEENNSAIFSLSMYLVETSHIDEVKERKKKRVPYEIHEILVG